MVRALMILVWVASSSVALGGQGRIGAKTGLLPRGVRPLVVHHGKGARIGTIPFFGYPLLVSVKTVESKTSAVLHGLVVPARIAASNAQPLTRRKETLVSALPWEVQSLARSALQATGFAGEVEIETGALKGMASWFVGKRDPTQAASGLTWIGLDKAEVQRGRRRASKPKRQGLPVKVVTPLHGITTALREDLISR